MQTTVLFSRLALVRRILPLLLAAVVLLTAPIARAVGVLIPAASRVDMVHDAARGLVYISTPTSVLRCDLASGIFLPPFDVPGANLKGIDLSPDGNTLIVADRNGSATHVWVHVIDLVAGIRTVAAFPRAYAEDGTWAVAFGGDGAAIITSTTMGSAWVPFRRFDPVTGLSTVSPINQNSMVAASAYGYVIGLAQGNSSGGPLNRYEVFPRAFTRSAGTGWYNYEIGVSRAGDQFAVPTYGGCFIYNSNLTYLTKIGIYAGQSPVGVVYHPADDVAFFAYAGTTEVRAFNTTTLTQTAAYDFQSGFAHPGNWAFVLGRLKISRDGTLLFATVNGGVRCVQLTGYNRPPVASPASAAGSQNTPISLTLTASDPDGNALSFVLASAPAHGSVSGAFPNMTYTPANSFLGADQFTFKVSDGKADSRAATVTLFLTNRPPTLTSISTFDGGIEDTPLTIAYEALATAADEADEDGDSLNFRVETLLSGSLTKNAQPIAPGVTTLGPGEALVWTPDANVNGPALSAFSVTAQDAASSSGNPATVSINIAASNDPPVVGPRVLTTLEDTSFTATFSGSDVEGDALTFLVVTAPAHGTVSINGAEATYTPATNYFGSDSFTYKANDGQADSAEATVALAIGAVNDIPTLDAIAPLDGAVEDTPVTIDYTALLASTTAADVDGDLLSFRIEAVLNGTLTKDGAAVTSGATLLNPGEALLWTPPADANGAAFPAFAVRVTDGAAFSAAEATVSLNVVAVNDPPRLDVILNHGVAEDGPAITKSLTGIGSGAANESQTLTITAFSSDPSLIPDPIINYTSPDATGSLTFKSLTNANGIAYITVTVSDGESSMSRTFNVQLSPINDAPTLDAPLTVHVLEDAGLQTVTITGITAGAPNESQPLIVTAVSGWLELVPSVTLDYTSPNTTSTLSFTPTANRSGLTPIAITVSDGVTTTTRNLQVWIDAVNDVPTVDSIANMILNEDASAQTVTLTGISNGAPDENQNLVITAISSNPALIPNPTVTYTSPNPTATLAFTPVANAFGTATITVQVQELPGLVTTRTFTVTVNPVNDAPTLNPISNVIIRRRTSGNIVSLSGITAGQSESQTLTVTAVSSKPSLVPHPTRTYTSPNTTGTLSLSAPGNGTGTATITVTVNDGQSASNTIVRTFVVTVKN